MALDEEHTPASVPIVAGVPVLNPTAPVTGRLAPQSAPQPPRRLPSLPSEDRQSRPPPPSYEAAHGREPRSSTYPPSFDEPKQTEQPPLPARANSAHAADAVQLSDVKPRGMSSGELARIAAEEEDAAFAAAVQMQMEEEGRRDLQREQERRRREEERRLSGPAAAAATRGAAATAADEALAREIAERDLSAAYEAGRGRHAPPAARSSSRATERPGRRAAHRPFFCVGVIVACCGALAAEIWRNGWEFQPLTCPHSCDGQPCFADGEPCEANLMLGPTVAVMDELGAKNDDKIFSGGEWWRVFTCNWLHAGVFHLGMNMMAVISVGIPLERVFGSLRVGLLYVLSGLFGAMVSVIFLPGVLSVGASASVFGLLGAVWAHITVNHCARCDFKGAKIFRLALVTAINLLSGITPYVDNFMHVGGFVAGLFVGMATFTLKLEHDLDTGRRKRTRQQCCVALLGGLFCVVLALGTLAAALSSDVRDSFYDCPFCESINCVEISWFTNQPWWSCCLARAPGTCALDAADADVISASCNMTASAGFSASCDRSAAYCAFDAEDAGSIDALCKKLCAQCS